MPTDPPNLLRIASLTAEVVAYHERCGGDRSDPLITGTLARRLRGLLESAAVPSTRIRNKYFVHPRHIPLAAGMLGLRSK